MDKQRQAYNFFIKKGYTPEVSAGIVGNLIHESGLNTGIEGDKGLKGGSSFGLAQWREGRLNNLHNFAKTRNSSWSDFNTQLEFVDYELNTTEKATLNRLMNTRTPEEASDVFMRGYERPSKDAIIKSGKLRAKNARNLFGGTFTPTEEITSTGEVKTVPNFIPTINSSIKGDSSHLMAIDLPIQDKVVEAKKDILNNEISKAQQTVTSPQNIPIQPEVVEDIPTYQYLTQTNLFQLD